MGEDLLAALRAGVENGSVPQPISGESINDFRFRTAHAGAIIGIKWAQALAEASAQAAAEAELYANLDAVADGISSDDYRDANGQGWRHGDTPVAPHPRHFTNVPPEQNEAAGV
jgi:hypothetical protein